MDKNLQMILWIIVISVIVTMVLFITTPRTNPYENKYNLRIDTHGIKVYTLKISGQEPKVITELNHSLLLNHGEHYIEACYYDLEGKMKCEGQRIWLDEDLVVEFFVGGNDNVSDINN